VARLPEEERGLVLGVYREGRTYEEMAERSGVPLGTLKRRLRTALASLRRRLVEPTGGG
jgi:RNA polymerase sigma-70 factor (ECF subfamily)